MASKVAARAVALPSAAVASNPAQTYRIDYVNDEIIITQGSTVIHRKPIAELRSIRGVIFLNKDALIAEQQGWNYLDSIKDGINIHLLQSLNIYPRSGTPNFNELHDWENAIIGQVSSNLSRRTWTKLYRLQDKEKILVPNYLWESGMGGDHFIEPGFRSISTFGSFIDPLNKPGENWPPPGFTIDIRPEFMEALGFGKSSIVATTTNDEIPFQYRMNIMCGPCESGKCQLDDYETDMMYMEGNNKKYTFLTKSGHIREKTIFTVIKEWGDKSQVIIYLILYYVMKKQNMAAVMSTCDIVVFVLCIIFGIRCIFTGQFDRPIDFPTQVLKAGNGSYYSIIDYFPGTPFENEYGRLIQKIRRTVEENTKIIVSIEHLRSHPDLLIHVQGTSGMTFPSEFYDRMIADMKFINDELEREFGPSITVSKQATYEAVISRNNKKQISQVFESLKTDSARIDDEYLLVPMIKQKGNHLCMTLGKSYTLHSKNRVKPSFEGNTDTFYNIGRRMTQRSRGGRQRGGSRVPGPEDLSMFPVSNHEAVEYQCQKQLNVFDKANANEPMNASAAASTNANATAAIINQEDVNETKDLQAELDRTFVQSFQQVYGNSNNDFIYESIYETLYTLYIYEAERDGMASIDITPGMLRDLSVRHEIIVPSAELAIASLAASAVPVAQFSAAPIINSSRRSMPIRPRRWFNPQINLLSPKNPRIYSKRMLGPNNMKKAQMNRFKETIRSYRNKKVATRRQGPVQHKIMEPNNYQTPTFTWFTPFGQGGKRRTKRKNHKTIKNRR